MNDALLAILAFNVGLTHLLYVSEAIRVMEAAEEARAALVDPFVNLDPFLVVDTSFEEE